MTETVDPLAERQLGAAELATETPAQEEIAREAYLLYLANGARDGHAEEDWMAAERALRLRMETRQPTRAPEAGVADPQVPAIAVGVPDDSEIDQEAAGV